MNARMVSVVLLGTAWLGSQTALSQESPIRDGSIAYAVTSLRWATYVKPEEPVPCPHGVNDGPREQFSRLYPQDGGQRALADTQLRREIEVWFPTTAPDRFEFREASGPIALGLNLDGRTGPNDFTSPEGESGIDNQLYRAIGCINSYRDAHGTNDELNALEVVKESYNRWLIEITGIFIQHYRGRIVDGVLETEPGELAFPWSVFGVVADHFLRGARFKLKLTPTGAEGLIGGYADIETWYLQLMRSQSTHCQSYGQLSSASLYKAMRRLADGYPDTATGANTSISSALRAQFTQVYILPASKAGLPPADQLPRYHAFKGAPFPRTAAEEIQDHAAR